MPKHTILITGCSTGIGRETAQFLRERGHHVIASARREADVAALQALGLDAVQLDVDDPVSIRQGLEAALALAGGRITAYFGNAGYGQTGAAEDVPPEALHAQFQTNFFGPVALTNLLIPHFRAHGEGRIIVNSSILGLTAMRYRAAYSATKFALEGWYDAMRLELHGTGIHVSLVEPGPIVSQFRPNALKAFKRYINWEHSAHQAHYRRQLARLEKEGPAQPFTLPAVAVARKVAHALESGRPRAHYFVTIPTYLFAGVLKRILPTRWLDALLRRVT
jgi:NAD(P)-dependent dehydrogenase (short-subunit alcohol dehydrogenase family)